MSDGPRSTGGRPLLDVIEGLARGGVELVVLREPGWTGTEWTEAARRLAPWRARGLRVVSSRRLDVASALELDGVHLGRDAVPVNEARGFLGEHALVGYSAHDRDEARRAAAEGASYVMLSPIYQTESKPGEPARGCSWLRNACADLPIPAFALGGVTAKQVPELLAAGASGVAAAAALGAAPDPVAAAREFRHALADEAWR
ncbi:MAG: thiamine phosphate synthase [Myxococcota bacterium]